MEVEDFTEQDVSKLAELQPEDWSDIFPSFQFYCKKKNIYPVKIQTDGKILSVGSAISFGSTSWLAGIIVHPDYRGQGLAKKIMNSLLSFLKKSGCRTISLIATEMGHPLYKKFGFQDQSKYIFFENKSPKNNPEPHSHNIFKADESEKQTILKMDQQISGERREEIIAYKLNNAFVYKEGNSISGFYLPELGEGFIAAETPTAGEALLQLKHRKPFRAVLPEKCKHGQSVLMELGFSETQRVRRMVRGPEFKWQSQNIYSRIGGKLG